MLMDISEVFTLAVREVAPSAVRKGLTFSFDYRGPRALLSSGPLEMKRSLQRLFDGVIDLLEGGRIVFDAETRRGPTGKCMLHVTAAGSGRLASAGRQGGWLARLRLHEAPCGNGDKPRLRRASGRCPDTGGRVEFVSHPAEGLLFTFQADTLQRFESPGPQPGIAPHASNAQAWLIHDDADVSASLARRMNRLGWTTTRFRSPQQAAIQLRTQPHGTSMPALLIATECAQYDAEQVAGLRPWLAPWTRCLYAVVADSAALARRSTPPGYELRVHPLSPAELDELSQWLAPDAAGPSCDSFPIPLNALSQPRMLIVDDDVINRVVATGMAQCLGHDVEMARDGLQAIDRCLRAPPSVILMDIEMPRMNGLEATRHIRALQRRGALPPCRILATTSVDSGELRRACVAAGMDGYLMKPLCMSPLQSELRRVCVGSERER